LKLNENTPKKVIIRLPPPHKGGQDIFVNWNKNNPDAQVLIAPSGTKLGKTFGASLWIVIEALTTPNLYCAWIAPTYLKCHIAFRYITRMLPQFDLVKVARSRFEIKIANGSLIKFLHGSEAETVIEGENVDRFVLDEAGKINRQVWYSLFTTVTQTRGKGIITGTPRGFTWYYDLFKKAQSGDPFFVWAQLRTVDSPYVSKEAIAIAERLLPPHLFAQYYKAEFISAGSVFGDLAGLWDHSLQVKLRRYWLHPIESEREGFIVHGVDIAKKKDFTVVYSVNSRGKLVGFVRTQHMPYTNQVELIKTYIKNYFDKSDNMIRYDATGVGEAFGDMLNDSQIDASIEPVTFTNQLKAEMLTKTMLAIQTGWHQAPFIPAINHEFSTYEITVSKFGSHKYSAPDGEHDDVVSAAMLSLSHAYYSERDDQAFELLTSHFKDGPSNDDIMTAYSPTKETNKDDFFDDDNYFNDEVCNDDLDSM
jgi:hypothetical protein